MIAIALVVLLSISLVGCGAKTSIKTNSNIDSSTSSQIYFNTEGLSSTALGQNNLGIVTKSSITTSQLSTGEKVQSDLAEIEAMLDETEKLLAELDQISASDMEIPNP